MTGTAPQAARDPAERRILPQLGDGLAVSAAVVSMMVWTWRTWPDPLVDFGRELYLAWQLSLGRSLYVDNAYYDGPLAPYLNALWMRLFGANMTTILVVNLVVMVAAIVLLYALIYRAAGRTAALTAALLFVAFSGFGRLVPVGNYNFMAPYSHHCTYGFVLSLAAFACIHLPAEMSSRNVVGAGILLGLVFLTKVEFIVAAAVTVIIGFVLRAAGEPLSRRLRLALLLVATATLPFLIATCLLTLRMPARTALRGALGSVYWLLGSRVSSLPFFRTGLGIDDARGNLLTMFIGAAVIFAAAAVAVGVAFVAAKIMHTRNSRPAAVTAFVVIVAVLLPALGSSMWFDAIPKALPLAMAALVCVWSVGYLRAPRGTEHSHVLALRTALCVYALALLGKMFLNTRLYHYGFVLAVPALLLLAAGFISWLPDAAAVYGANRGVARAVGVAYFAILLVVYIGAMVPIIRNQRYTVGDGSNKFYADERGAAEQTMVQYINRSVPADATLAVVPEGAMVNFLTRHTNPTPHSIFMPPEVLIFGEDAMLKAFESSPPSYVLLCHKDTTEFGFPLFGTDYGQNLGNWIRENYTPVVKVGDIPLQDPDRFGMLLLRRKDAPPER